MDNAKEDGDIDLFIISKANRVWTSRFISVLFAKILNLRPKENNKKNKICLSFYIDENNMNIESISKEHNIHFIYWLSQIVPIYDENNYFSIFFKENNWIKKYLKNIFEYNTGYKRKIENTKIKSIIRNISDHFSSDFLENILKKFQFKTFNKEIKNKLNLNDDVFCNNNIIKLHTKDRREEYANKFEKRIKKNMKNFFNKKTLNILIFIFIILLPLQTRYFLSIDTINNIFFEYQTISIYLLDLYVLFFIIYLFIYNIKNNLFILNNKRKLLLFLLIIFNVFLNISIINSLDKNISIYFNFKILILSIFIFLLSFIKSNIESIKEFLITSSLIQAIFSIMQFMDQKIFASKFMGIAEKIPSNLGVSVLENNYGRYLRSYGSFPHPNILGIFLLIGLILLIF